MEARKPLYEFPCILNLKVIGHNADDFEEFVAGIVSKHFAVPSGDALRSRLSKGGKYLSLTVPLMVESQEPLDALYRELCAQPRVLLVL